MHSANIRKRGRNSDPLLQVPPAGRGNRAGARLGSPREAGGEPAGAGKGTAIRFKNTVLQGNFFPTRGMESPLTPTSPPLSRGERAGSGGILPAKTHPLVRRMNVAGVPLSDLQEGGDEL
jgi:hypothetical protein